MNKKREEPLIISNTSVEDEANDETVEIEDNSNNGMYIIQVNSEDENIESLEVKI